MSTSPTPTVNFGRTVVLAQSALSRSLADTLRAAGSSPDVWLPVRLVATLGPAAPHDRVTHQLGLVPDATPESVQRTLEELVAVGLITDDGATIALTDAGTAEYERLRVPVQERTDRTLRDLDPGDIATTVRTLQVVTERLTAT